MTRRGEQRGDVDADVLPAWVRYPVIVVGVAVVLIGLIIAMYDRGVLPLVGPFVAVIFASTLVYLIVYARSRRLRRVSADAITQLQALDSAIAQERSTPIAARSTGTGDASLDRAAEQTGLALQRFAWGHEQGALPYLSALAAEARDAWHPEARLTQQVERLAATGAELDGIIRKLQAAAERRPRSG